MKVLCGETFDNHNPIYCELVRPNCTFTESVNKITEVNFNFVWYKTSGGHLEAYGNILDNISIELWADFVSSIKVSCHNALHHHQMEYLYSARVVSVSLAFDILVKYFSTPGKAYNRLEIILRKF